MGTDTMFAAKIRPQSPESSGHDSEPDFSSFNDLIQGDGYRLVASHKRYKAYLREDDKKTDLIVTAVLQPLRNPSERARRVRELAADIETAIANEAVRNAPQAAQSAADREYINDFQHSADGGPDAEGRRLEAIRRRLSRLTPREREVLNHILAGRITKQIAGELSISPRTVEIHRARVMRKMGATNLASLVRLATHAEERPARSPAIPGRAA
jgi:DNA-binding CsgD family transcriptional regulator